MNPTKFARPLIAMTIAGLLAACGQSESPEPTAAAEPAPAPVAEAPAPAIVAPVEPTGPLWLEPLANCGTGQVSTLYWKAELFAQGPVEIRLGEEADAGLFAKVGGEGRKQTGPWLKPGALIVARAADGTEVGRVVAAGPDCAE